MASLKSAFGRAAFGSPGSDTFWLLIWIIFIIDDGKRRERKRRKKRERAAQPLHPKPPSGPRPF